MSACRPSCRADRKFCQNAKFNVPFYPIRRHSCNLKKPSVHFLLFAHYLWFPNMHGQASPSVINLSCFPRVTASHSSLLALQLSLQRLCPEADRNLDKTYKTGSMFSIPIYAIFLATLFTYSSHCSAKSSPELLLLGLALGKQHGCLPTGCKHAFKPRFC